MRACEQVHERLVDFYKYYFFQTLSVMGGLMLLVSVSPWGLALPAFAPVVFPSCSLCGSLWLPHSPASSVEVFPHVFARILSSTSVTGRRCTARVASVSIRAPKSRCKSAERRDRVQIDALNILLLTSPNPQSPTPISSVLCSLTQPLAPKVCFLPELLRL